MSDRFDPRALTGLQLLEAMLAGKLPPPSIATTIPMQGVSVEAGRVVFQAQASGNHLNPMGAVHGGFAATVLDTVTGCAVHSLLGAGDSYATVDLNVKMVRPVPRDVPLQAEGNVINISRSLAISEGRLTDAEGKLLAYGTASCILMRAT